MTSVPFFLTFFVLAVSFATWRGAGPERVTAGAYVIALAATLYVGAPGNFEVVPVALLLVDIALLMGLSLIAVRANRWWIIPAAGSQLVAVLVHASKLIEPAMIPNSYVFLTDIWSWPMVALLCLGTWAHQRRIDQEVIVPDWKPSSAPHPSPTRRVPQPD